MVGAGVGRRGERLPRRSAGARHVRVAARSVVGWSDGLGGCPAGQDRGSARSYRMPAPHRQACSPIKLLHVVMAVNPPHKMSGQALQRRRAAASGLESLRLRASAEQRRGRGRAAGAVGARVGVRGRAVERGGVTAVGGGWWGLVGRVVGDGPLPPARRPGAEESMEAPRRRSGCRRGSKSWHPCRRERPLVLAAVSAAARRGRPRPSGITGWGWGSAPSVRPRPARWGSPRCIHTGRPAGPARARRSG